MVNNSRSLGLIDPSALPEHIHIIGAGMIGSKVAKQLVRMGFNQITVWDFDKVESHNVGNQEYWVSHVGWPKTEALSKMLRDQFNVWITVNNEKVTSTTPLTGIVFVAVDSFAARREILEATSMNPAVKLLIDTRVATTMGHILTANPLDIDEVEAYEKTFYDDVDDVEEYDTCGTKQALNHMGDIIAGYAVGQLHNYMIAPGPGLHLRVGYQPFLGIKQVLVKK